MSTYQLVRLIHFNQEIAMSQNARENSNPKHDSKHAPTSERKKHEPPVDAPSPDDPIEVKPPIPSPST
jgi:hypothetical protein